MGNSHNQKKIIQAAQKAIMTTLGAVASWILNKIIWILILTIAIVLIDYVAHLVLVENNFNLKAHQLSEMDSFFSKLIDPSNPDNLLLKAIEKITQKITQLDFLPLSPSIALILTYMRAISMFSHFAVKQSIKMYMFPIIYVGLFLFYLKYMLGNYGNTSWCYITATGLLAVVIMAIPEIFLKNRENEKDQEE